MKPTIDLSEIIELPEEMKEKFLKVWDAPEFRDEVCLRCGALVEKNFEDLHITHHKNISFVIWNLQAYVVEHMNTHNDLLKAFPGIMVFLEDALKKEEGNG